MLDMITEQLGVRGFTLVDRRTAALPNLSALERRLRPMLGRYRDYLDHDVRFDDTHARRALARHGVAPADPRSSRRPAPHRMMRYGPRDVALHRRDELRPARDRGDHAHRAEPGTRRMPRRTLLEQLDVAASQYHNDPAQLDRLRAGLESAVAADPHPTNWVGLARISFLWGDIRAATSEQKLEAYERGRHAGQRAIELAPRDAPRASGTRRTPGAGVRPTASCARCSCSRPCASTSPPPSSSTPISRAPTW